MADILQITEDIPVDDSIYEYEYKEYNPIAGKAGDLNRGSIVIVIEAQDIYTHPAESFLIVEGQIKYDKANLGDDKPVNLINNAIMYLFSDVRYHLASHEIEVLQNPGYATSILGMLKYPDDFINSQGLNQLWAPDNKILSIEDEDVLYDKDKKPLDQNNGFTQRYDYLIETPTTKGKFSFKIPLKHFLGFCEDYKKVIYGMQQRLTLTRTGDNDAIYTGKYAQENKYNQADKIKDLYAEGDLKFSVHLEKIRWFMPHVIPSDAYRLQLDKIIERKEKIPVGYRMLQCDNAPVSSNNNFTWRLGVKSSPDIPRFIIVGFQTGRNNKQNKNPAVFDHCNVRNIYVTLNAKRYPDTDYENDFKQNNYSRIYGDAATFRKKFFNMDELISNSGIDPINYKYFFPLFVFDVSKQSKKLKTSVSDIHIKASFNDSPPNGTIAYAVIISDRLFHFVSDGSKITNIV